MEFDESFALHITWTCYGTRLPGDARGYVSNTLLPNRGFEPKQNIPGTPCTADDARTHANAARLQKWETARLSQAQALVVAKSLVAAAQKRGWAIARASVMADHVHVVVMGCPDNGEAVRRVLKGNTQASLSDDAGKSKRWWTAGGSDRYKHGGTAISAAIHYVADQAYKLAEIIDMDARACLDRRAARLVPAVFARLVMA
jgi:REP element-mobilizing transposase RayT